MSYAPVPTRRPRRLLAACLFLLLLSAAPASAGVKPAAHPAGVPTVAIPVGNAWWRALYDPVESALGSQRRMIQFCAVGVCLGLYILMKR